MAASTQSLAILTSLNSQLLEWHACLEDLLICCQFFACLAHTNNKSCILDIEENILLSIPITVTSFADATVSFVTGGQLLGVTSYPIEYCISFSEYNLNRTVCLT